MSDAPEETRNLTLFVSGDISKCTYLRTPPDIMTGIRKMGGFKKSSMKTYPLQKDCPRPGHNLAIIDLKKVTDASIDKLIDDFVEKADDLLADDLLYHIFDGETRQRVVCNCKRHTGEEHNEDISGIKMDGVTRKIISFRIKGFEREYKWGLSYAFEGNDAKEMEDELEAGENEA